MTDFVDAKLVPFDGAYDFALDGDDLAGTDGLDSELLGMLFFERRASAEEVPLNTRRGGWFGNLYNTRNDFEMGSKLWLRFGGRKRVEKAAAVRNDIIVAGQYLIEDGYAASLDATVRISGGVISATIDIASPSGQIDSRSFELWRNTPTEGSV